LCLPPFTMEQVQELAQRHGLDWSHSDEAQKLTTMLGGHPYLVRLALYHLVGKGGLAGNLQQLLKKAPTEAGIYNEYLRQYVLALRKEPEMAKVFYNIVTATDTVQLEPLMAYKLHSMGLIELKGDRAQPICELYRLYFREQLDAFHAGELEKHNQQLRIFSSIDELTQLANRRYFYTYLQIEWQRSHQNDSDCPLSLILCDIDHFKMYNRTYGDAAGDDCLRQIANTMSQWVKDVDIFLSNSPHNQHRDIFIARYGGEEFAILIRANALTSAYLAENIREQVKALAIPCDYPGIGGLPASVLTVSLGVASIIPNSETEAIVLINTAEKALYQAKRKGRDRVIFE
jgi:diguanylate cyclase (GGDEF)-like protein